MEHNKLFKCLYMYQVTIGLLPGMSERRCHGNLLALSKTAPLCLRQILVVRMSVIHISDR